MEPRTLDTESLLLMLNFAVEEERCGVVIRLWWRVVLYSCDRRDA